MSSPVLRAFLAVTIGLLLAIPSARGGSRSSLVLSGQVEPQLSVTTSVDWAHWKLRLENSSNVEAQDFWIDLGPGKHVLLKRTALLDLNRWMTRNGALPGQNYRVTIASP